MDIKKLDRKALKSFFVKNAIPTEGNFRDLIDGMINQKDDGIVKLPDEPLSLQADGSATSQKKVINFYGNFADPKPAWTLSLNAYVDPNNPATTARPGWNISDADGNSRLFIDQNTGNVGIGTLDPKATLEVSGRIKASDICFGSGGWAKSNQGGSIELGDSLQAGVVPYIDFHYGTGSKQDYNMRIINDANGRLSINGGNFVVDGGRVGIGTTNPLRHLHVDGGSCYSGELLISGTGKWDPNQTNPAPNFKEESWTYACVDLLDRTNDRVWHISHRNAPWVDQKNKLMFWYCTNTCIVGKDQTYNNVMTLTPDGQVGIGTSDPQYSFEIKASSGIKLGLEGSGGGQLIIANNKDDNRIYLEAFSSDGTGIASELLLTGRHGKNVPNLSFRADLTAVSGNVVVNGNVGIGTSDPKGKLDVNGMVRITSVQNADKDPESGMTYGGSLVIKSNQPQIDFIDTEHNDWSIHVNSNKMYFIRQPWIYSDLVLDGAGSVGIGTDTPKGKLEVNGVAVISNGHSVAAGEGLMVSGSITVGGNTTSYGGGQGWISNIAGLLLETAANTEIAVHDSGTRVASLMYYEGDAANRITIGRDMGWGRINQVVFAGAITPATGNSNTAGIQFPADPGGGANDTAWIRYYPRQGEHCTLELGVGNDAEDHIALMSSGSVGIGTLDPKGKLDVMGDIAIQSQHAFRGNDKWLRLNQDGAFSSGVHTPGLFVPGSLNVGGFYNDPGLGNLRVAGSVGIGTASPDPSNKLQVEGNLHVNGNSIFLRKGASDQFDVIRWNEKTDRVDIGGYNGVSLCFTGKGSSPSLTPVLSVDGDGNTCFAGKAVSSGDPGTSIYSHSLLLRGIDGTAIPFMTVSDISNSLGYKGQNINIAKCSFTAQTKNFEIPHPLDPERRTLVHSCLEGPEIAVFYRGKGLLDAGEATIRLPEYFEALTAPRSASIMLTPVFHPGQKPCSLAASEVADGAFTVIAIADSNSSQAFFWEVKATRKDVAPLEVEPCRAD